MDNTYTENGTISNEQNNGVGNSNIQTIPTPSPVVYFDIPVKFYDYYNKLYNQQTIKVPGELISKDLTLDDFVQLGLTVPTAPDINKKTFLMWVKYPIEFDNNGMNYIFKTKYIITSLGIDYCDNQLDDLEDGINSHDNNINLHIDEQTNQISNDNIITNELNDIDSEIIDEIDIIKDAYNINNEKLSLIDSMNYDNQFSYIYSDIQEIQDEITYMGISHMNDLHGIGQIIDTNENIITNLQNKVNSFPKHYILSQNAYRNLNRKDKNAIYFTKENN